VQSLTANTSYPDWELLLIDNGSTDGTRDYLDGLASSDDRIRVFHNEQNVGFSRSANQGVRAARGELLCFLNNDMQVPPGWLKKLIDGLGSGHYDLAGPKLIWRLMDHRFGRRRIPYIEGSCLMVRRRVLDHLGGFDEEFSPAYWEDTDFGYRAYIHGYNMKHVPLPGLVHHGGRTAFCQREFHVGKVGARNERYFYQKWASHPFQRILAVRIDSLGDVVMTTPVVAGLRQKYPNAEICMLTKGMFVAVYQGTPYADRVLDDSQQTLSRVLKNLSFDIAVNLQDHEGGRRIVREANASVRLGLDEPLMAQEVAVRQERCVQGQHLVDVMARMAGVRPYRTYWRVEEREQAFARQLCQRLGLTDSRPKVGLHLFGSSWEGKNWPLAKAEELVRLLRAEECVPVLFGSGPAFPIEGAVNLVNQTNIRQLAALLAQCDLLVSMDSGPMHIAGALGVPTVTTYGPTDPRDSAPYKAEHYPLPSSVSCSPCFEVRCLHGDCLCAREVPVSTVMEHVTNILKKGSRPLLAAAERG
jgi:ADP-heptose:LPS heptosyltransferase/GT2 family glycosyltransferase